MITLSDLITLTAAVAATSLESERLPAMLPLDGTPDLFWASASPDDPRHLLACTFENLPETGRHQAAAYVSFDGGVSWQQAIRDRSSDFVSEVSCEAGPQSVNHFLASASATDVPDREGSQHASGTTRLYSSANQGLSWRVRSVLSFLDWTQMSAPSGDELLIFSNDISRGTVGEQAGRWSGQRGAVIVNPGRRDSVGPLSPQGVPGDMLGAYPVSTARMSDGRVLALFVRTPRPGSGDSGPRLDIHEYAQGRYRWLTTLEQSQGNQPWNNLFNSQIASGMIGGRETIVVASTVESGGRASLILYSSADAGASWNSQILTTGRRPADQSSSAAAVAIGSEGAIIASWRLGGACPTIFTIGHASVTSRALTGCETPQDQNGLIENSLVTITTQRPITRDAAQARPVSGLTLRISDGATSSANMQMVRTADGGVVLFWARPRANGRRTLYASRLTGNDPSAVEGSARDLSESVLVRMQSQAFEADRGTLYLNVYAQNAANAAVRYPSYLRLFSFESDCGAPVWSAPTSADGSPIFEIANPERRSLLLPGEATPVVQIGVRLPGCELGRVPYSDWASRPTKNDGRDWRSLAAARFTVWGSPGPGAN